MDDYKLFYQYLYKFIDLNQFEFDEYIRPFIAVRQFGKKAFITRRGEIENYMNFITAGLVRKYYKKDGEEYNVQISTELHIIHAQESFHSRIPTEYYIQTLEPTRVISITHDNLEKLYSQNAKMERLGRLVITFTVLLKEKWQMQMLQLTPRERFLKFIETNPDLVQRVPQKYLASYLNIQPETFSRFKHLVKGKNHF